MLNGFKELNFTNAENITEGFAFRLTSITEVIVE